MKKVFVAGLIIGGTALGATMVSASIPAPGGVVKACYNNTNGAVRVIDSAVTCKSGETLITWSQNGQPGPAGPAGAAGPAGPTGPKGDTGSAGPIGPAGADGEDGAPGPAGPAGADGAVGPAGADGAPGPAGPEGPAGPAGADGAPGPAGADGAPGPAGPIGPVGPAGPAGATGATGPAGSGGLDIANSVTLSKEMTVPSGEHGSMNLLCPGNNRIPTGFQYYMYSGQAGTSPSFPPERVVQLVDRAGTFLQSTGQYWGTLSVWNMSSSPSVWHMDMTCTAVLGGAKNPGSP